MKKRTLNQTWILCLQMWRWIAKVWDVEKNVGELKIQWLREHGFPSNLSDGIYNSCFFCEYNVKRKHGLACRNCPGVLVNKYFTCGNEAYNYETNPAGFYKELLRLNRIRKAKK